MSGHSYGSTCPNCRKEMDTAADTKPFDVVTNYCNHCGFYTTCEVGYADLEELNDQRVAFDLEPLKELPPQEFEKPLIFGERSAYLISRGMKAVGGDPEEIWDYIQEDVYVKDAEDIKEFLQWISNSQSGYTEQSAQGLFYAFKASQVEVSG